MTTEAARNLGGLERGTLWVGVKGRKRGRLMVIEWGPGPMGTDYRDRPLVRIEHEGGGTIADRTVYRPKGMGPWTNLGYRAMSTTRIAATIERDFAPVPWDVFESVTEMARMSFAAALEATPMAERRNDPNHIHGKLPWLVERQLDDGVREDLLARVERYRAAIEIGMSLADAIEHANHNGRPLAAPEPAGPPTPDEMLAALDAEVVHDLEALFMEAAHECAIAYDTWRDGDPGDRRALDVCLAAAGKMDAHARRAYGRECEECRGHGNVPGGTIPAGLTSPREVYEVPCQHCRGYGLELPRGFRG